MMIAPEKPPNEVERLESLRQLNILDTPIQEPFERITRLARTLFQVPIASFTLIDSERQWFKSIQGLDVCETSREVSFCGHVINQDDVMVVNDATKDSRFSSNPLVVGEPFIRFYAGYPVRDVTGSKIGTICIIDVVPRQFTDQNKIALIDLAALIEGEIKSNKILSKQVAMANELAQAKLSSMVDGLTRLWNRAAIESFLQKQIEFANSAKTGFGVAIVDIDNFKSINDTYGHLAGDAVLRQVAKKLLSGYRDTDQVGRWGGEEFLVVIEESKPQQLCTVANRARELISVLPLECESNKINVSITTGVSYYDSQRPVDMKKLIESADKALYEGKCSGKNKVVENNN